MSNLLWKSLVRGAYKAAGLDSPYAQKDYRANWSKQRQKCLNRDDHTCRVCRTTSEDLARELSVHHITPRSDFDGTPRQMNALENLVSICPSCHGTFENRFTDCSPEQFAQRAREHLD